MFLRFHHALLRLGNTYPQAEGVLADCMLIYGKRLGEDTSLFGKSINAIV